MDMKLRFATGLLLGLSFAAGMAVAASNMLYFDSAMSTPTIGDCVKVAATGTGIGQVNTGACAAGGVSLSGNNVWTGTNAFQKQVAVTPVALTAGATVATDASLGNIFTLTLTQATTLSNPTNLVAGQTVTWIVTQAASGGPYALTFGTNIKQPGGTAPTMSTGVSKTDAFTCVAVSSTVCYMAGTTQNF
jgi:hypothetical protein